MKNEIEKMTEPFERQMQRLIVTSEDAIRMIKLRGEAISIAIVALEFYGSGTPDRCDGGSVARHALKKMVELVKEEK